MPAEEDLEETTEEPTEEPGDFLTDEELSAGEERPRFSWPQKISIGTAVLVAFLLGLILFFPVDTLTRYALGRYSRQLLIDFGHIDLNIFGPDILDDVWISTPDNYGLKTSKIEIEMGRWGLLRTTPEGSLILHQVEISLDEIAISLDRVQIDVDLNDLSLPPSEWRGRVKIRTFGRIRVISLPETIKGIALNIKPEKLLIRNLVLQARSNGGEKGVFHFDGSNLKSNLVNIAIEGNGQIRKSIGTMNMNAKICLVVDSELEKQNKMLYMLYQTQGGRAGEKLCIDMKGPLNGPQFQQEKTRTVPVEQEPTTPQTPTAPATPATPSTPTTPERSTTNEPAPEQPKPGKQRGSLKGMRGGRFNQTFQPH